MLAWTGRAEGVAMEAIAWHGEAGDEREIERVLETVAAGITIIALDGCVSYANPAAQKILALPPDALIGRAYDAVWQAFTLDGQPLPKDQSPFVRVMHSGEPVHDVTCVIRRPAASDVVVSVNASPFRDAEGTLAGVVMSYVDMTAYKQTQDALLGSQETARALLNATTETMALCDPDGTLLAINETGARRLGKSIDELVGCSLHDFFPAELAESRHARLEEVVRSGRPSQFVDERDGRVFQNTLYPVSGARGAVTRIAVFGADVTEQRRAEELSDALGRVNESIISTLDFGAIMQRVVTEAMNALGTESAAAVLREGKTWAIRYGTGPFPGLIGRQLTDAEIGPIMQRPLPPEPFAINDAFDDDRVRRTLMEDLRVRSTLIVPLSGKGGSLGFLAFSHHSEQVPFDEIEIDFARKLSASLSLVLENARLYATEQAIAQAQEQARQLSDALATINLMLNSTLDPSHIMLRVVEETTRALRTERGQIVVPDRHAWTIEYDYGPGESQNGVRIAEEDDRVTAFAARTREVVAVSDVHDDPRVDAAAMAQSGVRSLMVIPLVARGSVIGVARFAHVGTPISFTTAEVDFARRLGAAASLALDNARLYQESVETARLSEALNAVNASIGSTLDFDQILQRVVVECSKAIGAETANVAWREDDHWVVRYGHGRWQRVGMRFTDERTPVATMALESGEPIALDDAQNDDRLGAALARQIGLRSALIIPLRTQRAGQGVLALSYHAETVTFTAAQVDFARKLGAAISLALENAALYETQSPREAG